MTRLKRHPRSFFLRQESRCLLASARDYRAVSVQRLRYISPCTRLFIRSACDHLSLAFFSFALALALSLSLFPVSLFSFYSLSHFPSGVLLRKPFSYLQQRAALAIAFSPSPYILPRPPLSRRCTRTAAIIEEYCSAWTANRTRL